MSPARQAAIDIIELFEVLLEEHKIIIPDEDRPDDNDTPIYGVAYFKLEDAITDLLDRLIPA